MQFDDMAKFFNDTTKYRSESEKSKKMSQVDELVLQERKTFVKTLTFKKSRQINALYDTGANKNLIRKDLVPDKAKIKPSPNPTAQLFDGSIVHLLGYILLIQSKCEGRELKKVRFYVVAELSYPMIMGKNWIRSMRDGEAYLTQEICLGIYNVKVDEIGPVDALIDSGCNTCVVKRDVLTSDSIKSKITPGPLDSLSSADGSEMEVLGRVNLRVSFLGKTVEIPFDVVAETIVPMILGTTWIRKSRAILQSDGVKLAVTLGGKEENPGCSTDKCPSPYVPVHVDGIGVISALVDTGYSKCTVREDILTELQMSQAIQTSGTGIYLANGNHVKEQAELYMVSLNITFEGITTCMKNVDIVADMEDKLVLGMDWLDQTRAVIQSDGSEIIVSQPSDLIKNGEE